MAKQDYTTIMLIPSDCSGLKRQVTIRTSTLKKAAYILPALFLFCALFTVIAMALWPLQVRNARLAGAEAAQNSTELQDALATQADEHGTLLAETRDAYEAKIEAMQTQSEIALRNAQEGYEQQIVELRMIHAAYVDETQDRVQRVESMLAQLEDVTGIGLLEEDELADDADSDEDDETSDVLDGAGGAPHFFLGRVNPEAISYYDSRRLMEMDQQTQRLDVYYDNADKALTTLKAQADWLLRTPMIAPVAGRFQYTDSFGSRIHPVYRRRDFHSGLDMAARQGTPIVAPADGVVVEVGSSSSTGRYLEIDHGEGASFDASDNVTRVHYRTRYYHCSKINVTKGQTVRRGETIALVGSTGISTGPHLHYEVLVNGEHVDPADYILD